MDQSYYEVSCQYLRSIVPEPPEIAIVLGSALGPFADSIENPVTVDYRDIPNFLISTVASHAGKLIFGTVAGRRVVCMSGRFHYYEGYDFEQLSIPVRVLKGLGVRALILTNAAGAVNLDYKPGDLMLINDHIKLMGASPMRGPNDERIGQRFFDVSRMYDPDLLKIARKAAKGSGLTVHEGVYFFMPGPQFETPAEIRAIRLLGGDAVGMSTVTEALTAAHCGLPVLGISFLANMAAGIEAAPISDDEVVAAGDAIAERFSRYVARIVEKI